MTTAVFVGLLTLAVLVVYFAIAVGTWVRFRGTHVVVCPASKAPAAVEIDLRHAMASAIWEHPDLRVASCTGWRERPACAQPCVSQIEAAPIDTRPKAMAARFFGTQHCALCRAPLEAPNPLTLQPGFMNPATRQVDAWDDVPPEHLPDAIAGWRPLCPNCTLAESFRQRFPDRVTDRERHE